MLNFVRALWRMCIVFFLMTIGIAVSITDKMAITIIILSFVSVIIICWQGALEDEKES